MTDTCPKCGAPAKRTVNMRGGDHGWSTTDEERAEYKFDATPPAGAGEAVVKGEPRKQAMNADRARRYFNAGYRIEFHDKESPTYDVVQVYDDIYQMQELPGTFYAVIPAALAAPTPLPEAVRELPGKLRAIAGAGDQSSTADRYDVGYQVGLRDAADRLDALARECDCSLRTKLVGDGCEKCNPALAREGWRDISTAPKDAYEVLLADADSVCVGFWHDGSQCYGHRGGEGWFDASDRYSLLTASNFRATHWQPLPPPPTGDA